MGSSWDRGLCRPIFDWIIEFTYNIDMRTVDVQEESFQDGNDFSYKE